MPWCSYCKMALCTWLPQADEAEFENPDPAYPRPLEQNSAVASPCFEAGCPVCTRRLPIQPRRPRPDAWPVSWVLISVIFAPMIREDKVIGAVGTARPSGERFDERQVELMKTFADQAVIAIENVGCLTRYRRAPKN